MNIKDLTPEQKAQQALMLDAIREQASYEREKRRKLAEKVKDAGQGLMHILILFLLSMILVFTVGCEKQDLEIATDCVTYDLGIKGQEYEAIPTAGLVGRIYLDEGRVKQEICGAPCIFTRLYIAGDGYEWVCLPE